MMSSPENGSSISKKWEDDNICWIIAILCFYPPESCAGYKCPLSASPKIPRYSLTLASAVLDLSLLARRQIQIREYGAMRK